MSNPGIFVAGVIVFLIVGVAMGFVLWGLRMEAQQNRIGTEERARGVTSPSREARPQREREELRRR